MRLLDKVLKLLSDNQESSALELVKGLQEKQSGATGNTISTRVGDKTLGYLQQIAYDREETLSEYMREVMEDEVRAWGFSNDEG